MQTKAEIDRVTKKYLKYTHPVGRFHLRYWTIDFLKRKDNV